MSRKKRCGGDGVTSQFLSTEVGFCRTITTVKARVEATGGRPELAVLHYKPTMSLFAKLRPEYYAAVTDEHIIYPWEVDRDIKGLRLRTPE